MKMFKSLKNQLLSYFFIANMIVLVSFSVFIYSTAKKGVSDTLNGQLKILSLDAITDLKGSTYVDAKKIADQLKEEFGIDYLEIKIIYYNKLSKSIEHISLSSQEAKKLFEIPLNEMGHLHSIYYFDKEEYRISSMLLYEDAKLKVFFQLATKKIFNTPYLEQLFTSLIIAVSLIIIILLFIVNVLLNKSLRPVENVVQYVNKISVNDLSQRLPSRHAPSEIKELIQTFNSLLSRLQEAFNRISTFSADASHELKTPLTVIRGEIEVRLRQSRSSSEYQKILHDILQESIAMQETIDQLFFLTKKDTSQLL